MRKGTLDGNTEKRLKEQLIQSRIDLLEGKNTKPLSRIFIFNIYILYDDQQTYGQSK